MALRQIRFSDDEILRKKSRKVEKVDDRIRQILNDMADTLYNTENGGGLAAPQVGILKRLVVIDMGQGLIKLINPEIIKQEGEQEVVEGCLSIPNVVGKLKRPAKIIYTYYYHYYQLCIRKNNVPGFDLHKSRYAPDHLEGILFTDLVTEYIK